VLLKVEIELDQAKLKLQSSLKLNTGSGKYQPKSNRLVRKVGNQITMTELLNCFSEPERLTQENAWYCNVCKDHKLAEKAMQLYRTPQYLIVHLKRFNHRGDSGNRYIIYGEKVNTPIALEEY
jgi:ubiquitin C-terminal hydrolase